MRYVADLRACVFTAHPSRRFKLVVNVRTFYICVSYDARMPSLHNSNPNRFLSPGQQAVWNTVHPLKAYSTIWTDDNQLCIIKLPPRQLEHPLHNNTLYSLNETGPNVSVDRTLILGLVVDSNQLRYILMQVRNTMPNVHRRSHSLSEIILFPPRLPPPHLLPCFSGYDGGDCCACTCQVIFRFATETFGIFAGN